MGRDKASIVVGGISLAERAARALRAVAYPVLAVGGAVDTGLDPATDRGEGPLAALVDGADALRARGVVAPVLLVACDMPFVDPEVLRALATAFGDARAPALGDARAPWLSWMERVPRAEPLHPRAVVPVVHGRDQPLCACYAPEAVDVARALVAEGKRAMRDLLAAIDVVRVPGDPQSLLDVDTPEELNAILDAPA